nr:phage GP46 family protein [uncultured Rhodopila sp.]
MSGNLTTYASLVAVGAGNTALDIGLAYNAANECCDLVFANGDIQVDTTAVSAILMAAGCEARARPEDRLPETGAAWSAGAAYADLRGGWAGDALDAQGRRNGSRAWVYTKRGKANEATRQGVQAALAEAFDQVSTSFNVPIQLTVVWVAPMILGWKAVAGKAGISFTAPVTG